MITLFRACLILLRFDVTIPHVLVMNTNDVIVRRPIAGEQWGGLRQSSSLLLRVPSPLLRTKRGGG